MQVPILLGRALGTSLGTQQLATITFHPRIDFTVIIQDGNELWFCDDPFHPPTGQTPELIHYMSVIIQEEGV